ncbi:MAG: cobalamin-binding protein [Bacteroidetes bacterium]|nr:cobalamin-binding protein [Bacteroidota bacterium]
MTRDLYPRKILCLTEEYTEILCLLGQEHRIAGISAYTVRPEGIRLRKPVVCDFTGVNMDLVRSLQPDLILGFSDVQHEVARQLIKEGFNVFISNQRSVSEILSLVCQTGALVGMQAEAETLARRLEDSVQRVKSASELLPRKPRVYFEEWYGPLISGIRWVSELIAFAGGEDCFAHLSASAAAKGRVVQPEEVVAAAPDIILVSWCGKRFIPSKLYNRPGWEEIPAVAIKQVFEIDPAIILQPGPAALTDGLQAIASIITAWAGRVN